MITKVFNVIWTILLLGLSTTGCWSDFDPGKDQSDTETSSTTDKNNWPDDHSGSDTNVDTDTDSDTDTDEYGVLIEDFEDYEVGTPISTVSGDKKWELWPSATAIDAQVSDEMAFKSNNSLKVYTNVDNVLMLNYTEGAYEIEFMMYIKKDLMGYYNFQAHFVGGVNENVWAFICYFYAGGVGSLRIGDEPVTSFEFEDEKWIKIVNHVDLDADTASLEVDGVEVYEWTYSIPQGGTGDGTLDGINFFGHRDPPGTYYWLDDVKVLKY